MPLTTVPGSSLFQQKEIGILDTSVSRHLINILFLTSEKNWRRVLLETLSFQLPISVLFTDGSSAVQQG